LIEVQAGSPSGGRSVNTAENNKTYLRMASGGAQLSLTEGLALNINCKFPFAPSQVLEKYANSGFGISFLLRVWDFGTKCSNTSKQITKKKRRKRN
jgi:hypothetical protein